VRSGSNKKGTNSRWWSWETRNTYRISDGKCKKKTLRRHSRRRNFFAFLKTSKISGFHGSEHENYDIYIHAMHSRYVRITIN
jgi:hypothetical protein